LTIADKPKWIRSLLVAGGAFAALHLFHLVFPEALDSWNERLNDQLLALKTSIAAFKPPYDNAIVHVDLNNTSLRALKDYHPSRAHYARAIRNLGEMQAAVQMCDFIFVGETSAQNDRLLIQATQAAGDVVFGMAFRLVGRPAPAEAAAEDPESRDYLKRSTWKLPGSEGATHYYFGVDPLITLAPLAQVSRGAGFLTLTPDPDGVIRRIALIVRVEGGFYPSFALKSLCEFLRVPPDRVVLGPGALTLREALRPGASTPQDITIPLDPRGCMRINFVGPWGTMQHYNFSDIYLASDNPGLFEQWQEEFAGRMVLLSDISTGSADMGQVPIDEIYPLSGVHANAVNTVLTGSFIRELPAAGTVGLEIALLLAVTALSFHRSALVSVSGTLGVAGVYAIAAGFALLQGNLLVPVVRPLLILLFGWAGLSTWRAVENARLQAEIEKARQIAEHELEIGRKIQSGFLPAELPVPAGWEIAAHFQPARQVSGDFYDVFAMAEGRYTGIVIADVCDHGVGSALFMALTRSLLRAYALQDPGKLGLDPADYPTWSQSVVLNAVQQTNAYIAGIHGDAGMFATLFFGILNPATGELRYVNGGHEPPMLIRNGHIIRHLKGTGLPVGTMPDAPFRSDSVTIEADDRLVLYTDGITDATDGPGNAFSKEQLMRLSSESRQDTQALVESIVSALNQHVGATAPADDITLLAIRRRADLLSGSAHPQG
jgi:serine phosphatase RsbU (regulator of sigma subunit)